MKFALTVACFFALILSISTANSAGENATVSIAVVNVTYLLKNAPEAELATKRLKEKFSPKELELAKELDEITRLETVRDNAKSTWSDDEINIAEREIRTLKRERTRALEDFREELRFARDSALDEVQKSVFRAIEAIRIERKIDIVIEEYISASARVDLTPYVMTHLQNMLAQRQSGSAENNKAE